MGLNLGVKDLFGKSREAIIRAPERKVWSSPAQNFIPDSDGWDYYYELGEGYIHVTSKGFGSNNMLVSPFFFPDGAEILEAEAFGNGAGEWFLIRFDIATGVGEIVTEPHGIGIKVTGGDIKNSIIDNEFGYFMSIEAENGKRIYGGRIEYRI